MPKNLLAVSHLTQKAESDCLPVCAQMVLNYFGVEKTYQNLVDLLGTKTFGTPFRNIQRLERWGVAVTIAYLTLPEIEQSLKEGLPVIAGVHTEDLAYWTQAVDHVVVVIGSDEQNVYVNDPNLEHGQQPVPKVQFDLAQLTFDNLCAILRK